MSDTEHVALRTAAQRLRATPVTIARHAPYPISRFTGAARTGRRDGLAAWLDGQADVGRREWGDHTPYAHALAVARYILRRSSPLNGRRTR
ncbi:hypothetical protein [Streptomyces sp. Z26]|uniref:hypothetical protein n=1 Tax=Streptomyces sp. Z26 TaxID=2500177 RepID=UPI000EF16CC8|nr:hypothetical protein [Streptomyces sp. Z26]RLL66979.1 hypothetical protein D7M15_08980 [Streptomyces sp. Z26]